MKNILNWKNLTFLSLFIGVFAIFGQTNSVPVPNPDVSGTGLLLILIPLVTPLLIAAAKYFLPLIPSVALPVLAPVLGILLDYVNSLITGSPANPLVGSVLGGSGVAIREILDQVKQKVAEKKSE